MIDGVPRVYWDADVFVSYIEDVPDRAPMIEGLLAEARAGEAIILTSIISIAEVAYAGTERLRERLSAETEGKIDSLWAAGSPVKVVEVHPLIAQRARNLIRAGIPRGWTGLRAHDAIHLATAEHHRVNEIHTYEPKWMRYSDDLDIPIFAPRTDRPTLL